MALPAYDVGTVVAKWSLAKDEATKNEPHAAAGPFGSSTKAGRYSCQRTCGGTIRNVLPAKIGRVACGVHRSLHTSVETYPSLLLLPFSFQLQPSTPSPCLLTPDSINDGGSYFGRKRMSEVVLETLKLERMQRAAVGPPASCNVTTKRTAGRGSLANVWLTSRSSGSLE